MSKLPMVLTFAAGIATGAFTNIFTGLQSAQLKWRIAAMVAFLVSGFLLFFSAVRAESALSRAQLASKGADDLKKQFHYEFGRMGWTLIIVAGAACIAAVSLLMIATSLSADHPGP